MTRVSLVRHGQTEWNLQRRIQGASDIPLNQTGRSQAEDAGRALALRTWDAIYASPLSRAMETASIIATAMGLPEPLPLPELVERSYGEAEGMTGEEILEHFPEGALIPGQESRSDVVTRALPALVQLAEDNPRRRLIVVSHGGVIGSIARHVTDHARPAPGEVIPNGSIHDFVYRDGRFLLDRFNVDAEEHDLFTSVVQ